MPIFVLLLSLCLCLFGCNQSFAQGSKFIQQEPISEKINSKYDELHPVISPDGNFLFYTIRFHPRNSGGELDPGDIWVSELKSNGDWSKPENAGELWNNNGYNILYKFFDRGTKALLLNQNELNKPIIAVSSFVENVWSKPIEIKIKSYYNRSSHLSASISEDGNVLILSMESFGSIGFEDLYVSFRENDSVYSQPINLGNTINTTFQEMTPHLSEDGLALYFASNGHGGYGGRDIFISTRSDDTWLNWSEPKNLGSEVNSQGIELSFYESYGHPFAYVSSTQNSRGNGDIFKMNVTDSQVQLLANNNNVPKFIRPTQTEDKEELVGVVNIESKKEETIVEAKAVEISKVEQVKEEEEKREVFTGQVLNNPKAIKTEQVSNSLNQINRSPASVATKISTIKITGKVFNTSSNKALQATIQLDNEEKISTDDTGNFELLISDNQTRKAWVIAEGMKPLAIELNSNEAFPEFYLSEVGTLSRAANTANLVLLQVVDKRFIGKAPFVELKSIPKLKWSIKDAESKVGIEVSWQLLTNNQTQESGRTEIDGVIILAGQNLASSRLNLEAPGYKSQNITIENPLLNDQEFYLSKGISVTSILRNKPYITKIFQPNFQKTTVVDLVRIDEPKQPFTISIADENGTIISTFKISQTEKLNDELTIDIEKGIASFALASSQNPKKLKVISSGYFPRNVEETEWQNGNHIDISLEKIEIGAEFILSTLEFEQSTISFTDSTVIDELDRLADMLLNTEGLEIQLTGYTDNQGLARENMELSTERATAVKDYLIAKGIDASRIEARGLGSANPIASNQSPETRKLNRRVEVAIVKVGE
jgi:outer membrane protein OmpA-like peptidoglycan-associated protein